MHVVNVAAMIRSFLPERLQTGFDSHFPVFRFHPVDSTSFSLGIKKVDKVRIARIVGGMADVSICPELEDEASPMALLFGCISEAMISIISC